MEIQEALDILKDKYPQIDLEWTNNQWRISLFDTDCHWKDEAFGDTVIEALAKLI